MADYDVVIVGAGHNALVCAGYIAKAGYHVAVVERRHKVGGAVVTEEIVPGYKFDLGGSAHILINHTPIVADLELEQYGLKYLDLDPMFFAPFQDGSHWTVYKDIDKTCESIAAISPEDADRYRDFIATWAPISEGIVEMFQSRPTAFNFARHMMFGRGFRNSDTVERLTELIRGYGPYLRTQFKDKRIQALIGWMAAQSGPPPTEPLSSPFALWHPMYHVSGMKRPQGGSGMLTQALANMIRAYGGDIFTDEPVKQIVVRGGRAVGVETVNGRTLSGKRIVSGAHFHTTVKLLGDAAPSSLKEKVKTARVGNGFGMILRCAVDELPDYTCKPGVGDHHTAMQFICPDLDYLERAYGDYLAGRPSANPALISMTWSHSDPTLAPAGKHVMFLWGQYYPYEMADGRSWDDVGDEVAENMLATFAQYAPNVQHTIIDKLIETPLYLERELGLLRGNVMHLEMSIDQMFMMRPAIGMSQYRTPIDNLYLTGASTHPGGGIMGAAGMNAAGVVLEDITKKSIFQSAFKR